MLLAAVSDKRPPGRQRDPVRFHEIRSIGRAMADSRDDISGLERVLAPAGSFHAARARPADNPFLDLAVAVRPFHKNLHVRVRPVDTSDRSRYGDSVRAVDGP